MSDEYVPGPAEYASPDDPIAHGLRWRRERDAARATLDSVLDAIKGDRFSDGLQTAEDYVNHVLSTAGHLYDVLGFMEVVGERDRALAEAARLRFALIKARGYCRIAGLPMSKKLNEIDRVAAEALAPVSGDTE